MEFRIKDPKKRKLAQDLLGVENFNSNLSDTELRVDLIFGGRNFASNFFDVEQIRELAEGWNPFPQTKPERAGKYLIALKRNDGDRDLDFVDAADFAGASFSAFHSDIIAWREMPNIWKER